MAINMRKRNSPDGGALKRCSIWLKKKLLSSKRLPHAPLHTGVTSKSNNLKWKLWKFVFAVSFSAFIITMVYSLLYALFGSFPPSLLLFGAVAEVLMVFVGEVLLSFDGSARYVFDMWMAMLTLDFNIMVRLVKILIINVFYSSGYEDFSMLVVYASSMYSMTSIAVCKLSNNRFYFSINTIEDFITALAGPMYIRIFNTHNYVDACVYAAPIILAVIARLTKGIYEPVTGPAAQEIQSNVFQHFANRSNLVYRALRIGTNTIDPQDAAAVNPESLLEIAREEDAEPGVADPVDLEA